MQMLPAKSLPDKEELLVANVLVTIDDYCMIFFFF